MRSSASDPAAWYAAFVPALLHSVGEEMLVATWGSSPALRVPMLRAIASVAQMRFDETRVKFDETPVRFASRAFNRLAYYLCRTPDRAAFVALATQTIPADNPVWKNRLGTGGRACEPQ